MDPLWVKKSENGYVVVKPPIFDGGWVLELYELFDMFVNVQEFKSFKERMHLTDICFIFKYFLICSKHFS